MTFTEISTTVPIHCCPVCNAEAKLFEVLNDRDNTQFVVCCARECFEFYGEATRCLLFLPPIEFHCARRTKAVKLWNDFSEMLLQLKSSKTERCPHHHCLHPDEKCTCPPAATGD